MLAPDGQYSIEERRIGAGKPGFTVVRTFFQNLSTGRIYECTVQVNCSCGAASMRYVSETSLNWEPGFMIVFPRGIGTYFDWLYFAYTLVTGPNPMTLDQTNREMVRLKGGGPVDSNSGYSPFRHWRYVANAKRLRASDTLDTEDESQATDETRTGGQAVHQANAVVASAESGFYWWFCCGG